MTESTFLVRYEAARAALDAAVNVDEVKDIRDAGLRMKAYAKIAKDRKIQADAAAIVIRAERKLGVMIQSAHETGTLGIGRPSKSNVSLLHELKEKHVPEGEASDEENGSDAEPFSRVTLKEAGIDKKLSMRSQNWARLGADEFESKLQEIRDKIESTGAAIVNPQRDLSTADKKSRRHAREVELGAKQRALPDKKFGVILTDDEWEHRAWSDAGLAKAAANKYPVSSLDELKKRDVASIAADDCVLFMWTTVPHLAQAVEMMAHRGFTYKSQCIWKKIYPGEGRGMGYWFWIDHEILLVGTRGEVPAPAPGTQWRSVIEAPVGAHSGKPAIFQEMIEAYFPSLPKIELNARKARAGWDAWGFEAPDEIRQDDPADATGDGPQPVPGRLDSLSDALSDRQQEPPLGQPLSEGPDYPHQAVPVEQLSVEQQNDIIRAGYGRKPVASITELMLFTGLKRSAAKMRVVRLGLSDPENQKAAARENIQKVNDRRSSEAAP